MQSPGHVQKRPSVSEQVGRDSTGSSSSSSFPARHSHAGRGQMPAPGVSLSPERSFQANPEVFMQNNSVLLDFKAGFLRKYPKTVAAIGSRLSTYKILSKVGKFMADNRSSLSFYLMKDSNGMAVAGRDMYYLAPAIGLLSRDVIKSFFKEESSDELFDNADELVDIMIGENGSSIAIRANYAPYHVGNPNLIEKGATNPDRWDNVGGVEVDSATSNFVFTDSMNGCAWGITAVDGSPDKFKAWHFQSEEDNFAQATHFRSTNPVIDWYGVNEYYTEDGTTNLSATNMLVKKSDGSWSVLSQVNLPPEKGEGKTVYIGTSTRPLNTREALSEERLEGIHALLRSGLQKGLKQQKIDKINEGLQKVSIRSSAAKIAEYTRALKTKTQGMTKSQLAFVNDIAKRFTDAKKENQGISQFNAFTNLKTELSKISTPGRFFGKKYDEVKTQKFKENLINDMEAALRIANSLVSSVKAVTVTSDVTETNEELHRSLEKIKFFMDIFGDYSSKDWTDMITTEPELASIIVRKKALARKVDILASEKRGLFPAPVALAPVIPAPAVS